MTNDQQLLERITLNPKVLVGKPEIRGTRLSVEYVLNLLAHGATIDEIIKEYKGLTKEDVQACFLLDTKSLQENIRGKYNEIIKEYSNNHNSGNRNDIV